MVKINLKKSEWEVLATFLGTFNQKPGFDLYFSEKLLTTQEKNDYEFLIKKLYKYAS